MTAQLTGATRATTPLSSADAELQHRARRGLGIYFAILVPLSAAFQAVIISTGLDALSLVMQLVPALAAVAARLALREGFADVSFRLGGRRGWGAILQALVVPASVGAVAYGVAWATGLARFAPPPAGELVAPFAILSLLSVVFVSGEELGWRGYMLTRLIDAGVPRPVLASGLIWTLWHVPLVLAGVYVAGPSPALSAALVVVGGTAFSVVIARMRLATGSVWPAIAFHLAWNRIIKGGFDAVTAGDGAALWVGESGLLTALALVVAAVVLSRGRWTTLRHPGERDQAPARHAGQP